MKYKFALRNLFCFIIAGTLIAGGGTSGCC